VGNSKYYPFELLEEVNAKLAAEYFDQERKKRCRQEYVKMRKRRIRKRKRKYAVKVWESLQVQATNEDIETPLDRVLIPGLERRLREAPSAEPNMCYTVIMCELDFVARRLVLVLHHWPNLNPPQTDLLVFNASELEEMRPHIDDDDVHEEVKKNIENAKEDARMKALEN
jgi:hypothetical protein